MIIVECNPDKFVVKRIVPGQKIEHGGGKTGVLKRLGKETRRVVGIVDGDPHVRPPGEMREYIEENSTGGIRLLRRADNEVKKLIELSPDLEGWLIHRAKQKGIRLSDYNLPDNRKELHDIRHIEKKENFQSFIKKLIQKQDDEINALRRWIKEAIE